VYDRYASPRTPVPGVTLYLDDDPTVATTTDAEGQFTLSGVPAAGPAWIQVAPDGVSAGTIHGVAVEGADVTGVELFRWDRDVAAALEDQVVAMDPTVTFFPGGAFMVVVSDLPQTTIALAPMPPPGSHYALDAAGAPVLDAVTPDSAESPMVVFFNLGLHDPGDYDVTATHPSATCASVLPSPPTSIQYVSFAHVTCRSRLREAVISRAGGWRSRAARR
jgi:hypothetical protein